MKEKEEIDLEEEKENTDEATWEAVESEADTFEEAEVTAPDEPETADEPEQTQPEEAGPEKAESEEKKDNEPGEDEQKDAGGDSADEDESEKSGPFRRKEKKDKKDIQIEELTDQVRRQMAEFDNYRKRTEKEKTQMFETGAKSVIEKILPVIDNFERGLETMPDEEKDGAFAEGMTKVYRQMMSALDDMGVKAIEAEGAEFDPNLHNAVMHVDDEEVGENIVVEELQKGYTYRDSVVRHSMVKVAN